MNTTTQDQPAVLYLEPQNGLCNRLRAIDSAIALARDHDANIEILWNMWDGMSCALGELIFIPLPIEKIWYWSGISRAKKLLKRIREWRIRAADGRFFSDADMLSKHGFSTASRALAQGAPVYIRAYSRFYPRAAPYDWLIPSEPVKQNVAHASASFQNTATIGVHIRREKHPKAEKHNPLENFLYKMEIELQKNADVKFFLATDSETTETEIIKQFGNKVITTAKSARNRICKQDAIEAMVDLLCLAKTSKVIGTYWSSYSKTAAEIGGIELELANQTVVQPPGRPDLHAVSPAASR